MPDNKPPVYYWDSCVFLALVNKEPDRLPLIDAAMAEAERGKIEIHTSTFTIAEVAFAAEESAPGSTLDDEVLRRIDKLWTPGASPLRFVEFHHGVGIRARDVIRAALVAGTHKPSGADAVHIASALDRGVDELHTYNLADYLPVCGVLGLQAKHPEPLVPTLDYTRE